MLILKKSIYFILKQLCFVDKKSYDNQLIEQYNKNRLDNIKDMIKNESVLYCIYDFLKKLLETEYPIIGNEKI